jgi:hypothetical protein
VLISCYNAKD